MLEVVVRYPTLPLVVLFVLLLAGCTFTQASAVPAVNDQGSIPQFEATATRGTFAEVAPAARSPGVVTNPYAMGPPPLTIKTGNQTIPTIRGGSRGHTSLMGNVVSPQHSLWFSPSPTNVLLCL